MLVRRRPCQFDGKKAWNVMAWYAGMHLYLQNLILGVCLERARGAFCDYTAAG